MEADRAPNPRSSRRGSHRASGEWRPYTGPHQLCPLHQASHLCCAEIAGLLGTLAEVHVRSETIFCSPYAKSHTTQHTGQSHF